MRVRISAILLALLCIAATNSYGQDIIGHTKIDYSSKLPDVAAIQKAIEIPVSPFTGQANISIPVYTLTSRSISIPISLDYATDGIKADQSAGQYGLGWTLNAGGSIIRQVRGNEDEGIRFETGPHKYVDVTKSPNITFYMWSNYRDSLVHWFNRYGGYYIDGGNQAEANDALYTEFARHDSAISAGNVAAATTTPFFYNGLVDGEPDVFFFKFGAYSGKFIFGYGGTPILVPYNQDLQIRPELKFRLDTVTVNGSTDTTFYKMYYFNSFKISTPDGKDYYFGETDASKIYTPVFDKPNLYNGWQLTRVIDKNTADTMTFDYSGAIATNATALESKQQFIKNDGTSECPNNPVLQITTQRNIMGNLVAITTSKERLQLQKYAIIARDRFTGELFRQFDFTYTSLPSQRLGLKEFIIRDLKLNTYTLYSFDYYSGVSYAGTSAQDYWGYHNGANNGGKLMLGYTGCYTDTANRHPAWPAMQLDALIGINYPTGGKTIIEYEPHDANSGRKLDNSIATGDAYFIPYLNYSLPATIGGLRVKKVMKYDPISKDTLTTRYTYKIFGTGTSSGHLYDPPALLIDYSSLACGTGNLSPKYLRSAQSLYIGSGTGQHVSYNNVTVQEEKGGIANGYTEYEYYNDTNTDSAFYSNSTSETTRHSLNTQYNLFPSNQFKRLPENFLDGQEKEKRIFRRDGQLLEKTSTQYKAAYYTFAPATLFTSIYKNDACKFVYHSSASGTASDVVKGNWFYIDSSGNVQTGEPPSGGGVRPILPPPYSYYYMYTYIIAKMSVRPSLVIKQTFETPTKYVIDTTAYYYENTAHTNATSIVTKNSKGDTLKSQTIYSFDLNPVNNGDSTIYFMQKAFVNVPVASFAYTNSNITSAGYRTYNYKSRADSASFIISDENVLLLTPSGTAPASLNITATYPKSFSFPATYFQRTAAYKYNPDNTISYAVKKGNEKINLIWDYNKSYVVAQTIGADSSDLAFTSFETSYNGNWNVAGATRDTTLFLTGKRSYNLANGSITKSGLNSSKTYIVSYWSHTTAATVNSTAGVQGLAKNGWYYYEHKLPAATTSITISGSVTIDELRIFPTGAQMTSYCFNPMTGITAVDHPDNNVSYFEYDGRARLRFIRDADKNILKAASYFEPAFLGDTAVWRQTGKKAQQKCSADTNYYSQIFKYEEMDFNVNSLTYGATRMTKTDTCSNCDISAWKNTGTFRCQTDSSATNTGYQLKLQRDSNSCSATYNQTRWVVNGINTTSCPVPVPCVGENLKVINGACVTGTKIITASGYVPSLGKWSYTYHYAWLPDCVVSINYTAYSTTPVMVGGSCTPL